jgi:hypothetical protein
VTLAALLHCCTAALLHCCTAALLHCCTAALLHCCTAAPLHCCTAAPLTTRVHRGMAGLPLAALEPRVPHSTGEPVLRTFRPHP